MEGKTTQIIEDAINIVGTLEEDQKVFITGAHNKWVRELERRFRATGLVGVEFITINQIRNGHLRGRKGVLLIDDVGDFRSDDLAFLYEEKRILRLRSGNL